MARPRAEVLNDLAAAAIRLKESAHAYDHSNLLVPIRLFRPLAALVNELKDTPAGPTIGEPDGPDPSEQ